MPADRAAPAAGPRSASRTHVGWTRRINEDRLLDAPEYGLWAIADGMGGHYGGDVAAQTVIDALREVERAQPVARPREIVRTLERANRAIYDCNRGSGATVVALSLQGEFVHIVWAGDSRCYRIRDGHAQLLTHDHSLVQELSDAGLIAPEDAATHPQANVITRALGAAPECAFDERLLDYRPTDRFLLCSDGLSRTLQDDDLQKGGLESLADALLQRALARDGTDNISLILIEPGLPSGS